MRPTQVTIKNEKNLDAKSVKKDLVVYFKTQNMDRPKLYYQETDQKEGANKDCVACMLSIVPTFTPQ